MWRYTVELFYRPNVNRAQAVTRVIDVEAPNQRVAFVLAGIQVGLQYHEGAVPSSMQATITRRAVRS